MNEVMEETYEPETYEVAPCPCPKERYLAIFKKDGECLSYVTAPTGAELKKLLADIPVENIVCVWKGKPKQLKMKSVFTF